MTGNASSEALVRAARVAGITDDRLLDAIRATSRAAFVPPAHGAASGRDEPIPIGHDQVSTQPSLTARMIEGLQLTGDEHVLEIGTGSGYQTALLARLAYDVVSIERWPDLAERAMQILAKRGIQNVEVRVGDGSGGVPDRGPYDAIIVSAAFPQVPRPLIDQLQLGGRLVQPIGPGGHDQVIAFHRTADGLHRRDILTPARFVRLYGRYGYPP